MFYVKVKDSLADNFPMMFRSISMQTLSPQKYQEYKMSSKIEARDQTRDTILHIRE